MGIRSRHANEHTLRIAAFLLCAAAVLPACVDEKVVFRDVIVEVEKPLFEQPPDATFNFLGYFDAAEKETVCGNCHAGQQKAWVASGHAGAWEGLQASGGAQPFCEGCHSVSQLGNAITNDTDAGYNLVASDRYEDVQCESCHGSGFEHVQDPSAVQPLASALVGTTLDNGCGDCHSGEVHHPFVNEWEASPHAQIVGFAATRSGCEGCHSGQKAMQRFGVQSEYLEKDGAPLAVVCIVCHDPHGGTEEHQLRLSASAPSIEENLCAQCHNRRTVPDSLSSHGLHPHSPEAALLFGEAGFFFPGAGFDPGDIQGTHGTADNPKLCASCHISPFEVEDAATGAVTFFATGHSFRPIPCLDAEGKPQPFGVDCELTVAARSFAGCVDTGCHAAEATIAGILRSTVTDIQQRANQLHDLLLEVDPNGEDPGGEIDARNPTFTVAEGALFNHSLAEFGNETFGTDNVIGSATHNPFLIRALLAASIQAVMNEYPSATPPPGVTAAQLQAEIQSALAKSAK